MPSCVAPLRAGVIALALSIPAADLLLAQGHPTTVAPTEIRHIQSIAPHSGPPGTTVSVSTLNLPLEAKVHVGVGAMREGFEALAEAQQGEWGEIAVRVEVPTTTSWDRPIVFVAFNAIFAPIGMSDPFHVTTPDGLVRRSGTVTEQADGCLVFRDDDTYLYALTGDIGSLEVGDQVTVEGVFFDDSECLDAPSIGVSRIDR
jgi:hypothetical protein